MEELIKYYSNLGIASDPERVAWVAGRDDYYNNYLRYNHETNRVEKTGYRSLHLVSEEYKNDYWDGYFDHRKYQ